MEELNLLCDALSKSHPTTTYFNRTFGLTFADFEWTDNPITESQFDAAVTSVATNAYSRSRKAAYDLLNQDEMRYDDLTNSTTTWPDAIAAIKAEFPK
tara:strand:- start:96 stop:389 length:294 start_codon:yes stop_codon:yes gene_type:complete